MVKDWSLMHSFAVTFTWKVTWKELNELGYGAVFLESPTVKVFRPNLNLILS